VFTAKQVFKFDKFHVSGGGGGSSACSHGQPGERFFLPKTTGPSAQLKQETFFLALRCAARRLTA
jgi:hypothetical protein